MATVSDVDHRQARIRLDVSNPADELRALYDWLQAEEGLRGRVSIDGDAPSREHMGTVADVLMVGLGSGGAVTVLARSLSVWLRQQRSDVTVEISDTELGQTVKVSASRVVDAEALIREVLVKRTDA